MQGIYTEVALPKGVEKLIIACLPYIFDNLRGITLSVVFLQYYYRLYNNVS